MRGRKVFDGHFEHEGYTGLAAAIVLMAASDYFLCRKWLTLHPEKYDDPYRVKCTRWRKRERLEEVSKFFGSGWYKALTLIDADYLVNELDHRIAEGFQ